jgi:hypothetical protein
LRSRAKQVLLKEIQHGCNGGKYHMERHPETGQLDFERTAAAIAILLWVLVMTVGSGAPSLAGI